MKCPTCGCENFFIKDKDDEYEIYEFSTTQGKIVFNDNVTQEEVPTLTDEMETYCDKCAWHGKLNTLNK